MKQSRQWATAALASFVIGALFVACSKSEKVKLPTPDKSAEAWQLVKAFENGLQDDYLNQYVAVTGTVKSVTMPTGDGLYGKLEFSLRNEVRL